MATRGIPEVSVQGQHEEYFDQECTRCEGKHIRKEASYYCPTCHKYFCDRCQRLHREFKKEHAVLNSSQKVDWGHRAVSANPEKCPIHSGRSITVFCREHGVLCCAVCVSLKHSTCEDKSLVPGVLQSQELRSVIADLEDMQRQIQYVKDVRGQMRQELKQSRIQCREKLNEFIKEVENILEELETSTNLDTLYEYHDNDIQADMDVCDEIIRDVDDYKKERNTLTADTNEKQILTRMKTGKKYVLEARERLKNMEEPKSMSFNFTLETSIIDSIENIRILGKLVHTHLPSENIKSVTYCKELNIRSEKDTRSCDIQGICQMLDNSLILSDNNNKNLKRLDTSYTIVDECLMPGDPYSLCCSGNDEVAVALGSRQKVQFVSITDKMRLSEFIKFDHSCNGIACHENMLYIIDRQNACYVYKLTRAEKNIYHGLVNILPLSQPTAVAVSNNGGTIYIVGLSNSIAIADSKGKVVTLFKESKLVDDTYKDLCVDMKGNIIVCNKFGHNIVQLTGIGDNAGDTIVAGHRELSKPEVVFVDNYRENLIVQRNNFFGGSDVVLVFNITY